MESKSLVTKFGIGISLAKLVISHLVVQFCLANYRIPILNIKQKDEKHFLEMGKNLACFFLFISFKYLVFSD